MQVYFIVNPKSGKGLKVFNKFQKGLTITYKVYQTEYPKHATALTEQIRRQDLNALVVAVGGDGTINEVINGAINSQLTIGVISSGSGNDFARAFYSFKTAKDIEHFLSGRAVGQADIGQVSTDQEEKYFINNGGLGFDALISYRVGKSKMKRLLNRINFGKLVYVYHVLIALVHFKPFQLKVKTEDGSVKLFENVWFVVASNQPYFGGGMKISPHSNTGDGKLEYTIIHQIGKLHFLKLFWKVFKGNHLVYQQYVKQLQGQSCSVQAGTPLFGHVDGEDFTVQAHEWLNFSINQSQLKHVVEDVSYQEEYVEIN